jgi:hypothetical protein
VFDQSSPKYSKELLIVILQLLDVCLEAARVGLFSSLFLNADHRTFCARD